MTKVRLLVLLAVVALVLFPALAYAQAGPPCRFHGTVQVDGANVADGTVITATIDGDTYTATTSASSYSITVAQPDGKSYDGKTATFKIGSNTAKETGTWSMGGNVAVNLTEGTPPIIPGGGAITDIKVTGLAAGSAPTATWDEDTGVLTLGIPAGATGATGPAGAKGDTGEAGKDASSVIGIVAIVLAVIAILLAGFVMMRKQKA